MKSGSGALMWILAYRWEISAESDWFGVLLALVVGHDSVDHVKGVFAIAEEK